MPEMRLLFVSLALTGLFASAAAQQAPPPPSPLIAGVEFLRDARLQDIEALSAAIRLEIAGDPAVAKRDPNLPSLIRATERALQADSNNIGWLYGGRLLAFLRGARWGPALDLAISLRYDLDRGVIASGSLLYARLERLFRVRGASARMQFRLADSAGKTVWQSEPAAVPPEDPVEVALPVRELPAGVYTAIYSLLGDGPEPLVTGSRSFLIDPSWRTRESGLSQSTRDLALMGLPQARPGAMAAFHFVQWTAHAMAAEAGGLPVGGATQPHPLIETWASNTTPRFWADPLTGDHVTLAESYASKLAAGADPLSGIEDLRLAYISEADQSLRTFRLLLPATLPAGKPVPLVVLLHGFAGDESSWLDRLPGAGETLRRLARERQFAVLSPSARSRYSRFDGPDAADFDQLRRLVSKMRPIDPARTALIGHGPAAFAAINAALKEPATWPIAAGIAGLPPGLPRAQEGNVPRLMFIYASEDKLFPSAEARKWAYLLGKRIPRFTSAELPGIDNAHAPAASIERVIGFVLDSAPESNTTPEAARK